MVQFNVVEPDKYRDVEFIKKLNGIKSQIGRNLIRSYIHAKVTE